VELFKSTGVLSPAELASRFEVYAEQYILSIEMETNLVVDLASTRIYPATVAYLDSLASAASNLNGLDIEMSHNSIQEIASEANAMMASVRKLKKAISVEDFASIEKHMNYCAKTLCPLMLEVRSHADALECIVADDLWPLPKYQEMLFIR
jgi:glutamine synthetase